MSHPSLTQLEILGYKAGARVYVRALPPKNTPPVEALKRGLAWEPQPGNIVPTPVDGYLTIRADGAAFTRLKRCKDSGKWVDKNTTQDGIAELQRLNHKGYGIYYVVNAGGRDNESISRCPAIFYECDNVSKSDQWQRVDEITAAGYHPSLIIETRNSLHVYFRTYEQDVLGWRELQQRLIQRQDSDPGIINEARLMRLSGFLHWRWNSTTNDIESFPVSLRLDNCKVYSRAELDSFLPGWDEARWGKVSTSERVETDPSLSPWDIRNLAVYLDGYKENGRVGWTTAKCPAHNGQSDNSLHIEQSTGAFKCHAGCDNKSVYNSALELAKSRGYQPPAGRSSHKYSDLLGWLPQLKQRVEKSRRSPWGFGKKEKDKTAAAVTITPSAIEYKAGERLEVWGSGKKFMWDSSGTGTGKTFDSGRVTPEELGCERIFYVTGDPRNPSTPTLTGWQYLDGRHQGIKRDNHGKLRRAEKGEPYLEAANCGRVETIGVIRDAGIKGADSSDLVCKTCPKYEACRIGAVYGYLNRRAVALDQENPVKQLIAHPSSLPLPEGTEEGGLFPYEQYAIIWEEWTTILKNTRQIKVNQNDLDKLIAHLAISAPEILSVLQPVLSDLRQLMNGGKAPTRYGWSHHTLIDSLSPITDDFDIEKIAEATQPNLDFLNPTGEYGVDTADLPSGVRKSFTTRDETTATRGRDILLKQWLVPFLQIFRGEVGHLSLNHGALIITIPDDRLIRIANAAKRNIFLDATGHLEELALLLGVSCEEIIHVQQYQPPITNLEYIQVGGLGRLGQQRGNEQQRRAKAVVDTLKAKSPGTGVVRFKRYAEDGDYRHYIESRGVNDAEKHKTLIIDGIACENLESLAADFTCLYGYAPRLEETATIRYPVNLNNELPAGAEPHFDMKVSADSQFREFVRRRTLANIHQTAGRCRANRRPDETLQVYILGDFPLDVAVKLVKASDITLEAASTIERNLIAIFKGLKATAKAGVKQTQEAVAKAAGTTQCQVSKIVTATGGMDRVKKIFQMLIEPYSKWNNFDPPPDSDEQWMAHEFLKLVLEHEPENLGLEIAGLVHSCGIKRWKAMISSLDPGVHMAAVEQFVQVLPQPWQQELEKLLPSAMQHQVEAAAV